MTESIRILRSWGTASWRCCGQPAQSKPLCRGARGIRGVGAPAGKRRAGDRKPARSAGRPDYRALPPGADAAAGDGCGAGLHRPDPGAAALPAPAGRAQGSAVHCSEKRRCRCPTRWRGLRGKTRPAPKWLPPRAGPATLVRCAGQNRSRWAEYIVKKLSFDELTKNNTKNFILCPLVSGAVRVYD